MTVSLAPALSQWARVIGSALRVTFIVTGGASPGRDSGTLERPLVQENGVKYEDLGTR
jgi:hypothetical protein